MAKKLVWSGVDADTIAASDFVGAVIHSGATDITTTNVSGKDGLDVYLVNSSVVVTATQLDIDNLNATDDAVQAWTFDGTGNAIGSTTGSLNVNVTNASVLINDAALANGSVVSAATPMSGTEAALPAAADRMYLDLYNHGSHEIYIGPTGLDDTDGFPIFPGVYRMYRAGDAISLYGVCKATKTSDLRTLELTA